MSGYGPSKERTGGEAIPAPQEPGQEPEPGEAAPPQAEPDPPRAVGSVGRFSLDEFTPGRAAERPPGPRPISRVVDAGQIAWPGGPTGVIGVDDRVRVKKTTRLPFSAICALRIEFASMSVVGTGWLLSPRLVVTNAHCLHLDELGGRARSVEVIPALDGQHQPFGSALSDRFEIAPGWSEHPAVERDYGVIRVDEPAFVSAGRLPFMSLATGLSRAANANVCGYPVDLDDATRQYFHGRPLKTVEDHVLRYEMDTYNGQSGSPIWVDLDGQLLVIGIHARTAARVNSGVRITGAVRDQLNAWSRE